MNGPTTAFGRLARSCPSGPSSSRCSPGPEAGPLHRLRGRRSGARARTRHKVAWLLAYPDTYEIGLPNQGLQILYEILNERHDAVAERAYAPWTDLEPLLRADGPAAVLGRHPPRRRPTSTSSPSTCRPSSSTRTSSTASTSPACPCGPRTGPTTDPLIGAGGHCTYNPEPLADFLDFVVLGDGEEVVSEITEVVVGVEGRRPAGRARGGTCCGPWPRSPACTCRRCTSRLRRRPSDRDPPPWTPTSPSRSRSARSPTSPSGRTPKHQLVPLTEVVHDRLNVEVFRGCTRGCRFCQAGMITRPVRERPADQVRTMVSDGLRRTGYDEVALTSLSTADFSGIEEVVRDTVDDPSCGGQISVSLPSLRVDAFTVGIAAEIQKARRTGLTFAPEAGTWRMRQVINKLISEEDLYGAVESAYSQGWRRMKLYFLTGLPTETDEDTLGIADAGPQRASPSAGSTTRTRRSTVSVGGFVPKPFTPFQWFGQNTRGRAGPQGQPAARRPPPRARSSSSSGTTRRPALAEGLASRGDRRLGPVIEEVWRHGGMFQEWSEHFDLDLWTERARATTGCRLDGTSTATGPRTSASRGTTCRPACTRTSSGRTGETPWPRSASRTAGGRRATTAARAPATASSTSSPRPRRRPGGSQGTGQDLPRGGDVPVTLLSAKPTAGVALMRGRASASPSSARSASPATATSPGSGSGPCGASSCRSPTPRGSRPARRCTSGWPCRPATSRSPSTSTSTSTDERPVDVDGLPALLPGAARRDRATAAAVIAPGTPSLQQAVTSCTWRIEVRGTDPAP